MKYLIHNGHQLMTSNKLQKEVQAYLKSIDRTLLTDQATFNTYKQLILQQIQTFNEQNARCKPMLPSWFQTDKNDWMLSGIHFCSLMIYHVKTEI